MNMTHPPKQNQGPVQTIVKENQGTRQEQQCKASVDVHAGTDNAVGDLPAEAVLPDVHEEDEHREG